MTEVDLYLRISLDKTGDEAGVDRQEEACRDLAERMGWTVRQVYRDNSVSAVKAKRRPGFEALIEGRPRRIVMWSVDRLVRKGADLERLIELDIPVHSVMAGPMDLATASGRLNARLLTSVATFEGEIKAERQRAAAAQRAAQGKPWWPRPPFGFNQDLTANEPQAAALREVYAKLLTGASVSELARWLNSEGHTTNRGNGWTSTSLRPVLLNPRNVGLRLYEGKIVGEAAWPAIVDEDVFRRAVKLLTAAGRGGGSGIRSHLLTGLLTCGVCGGPMAGKVRKPPRAKAPYATYQCREKQCVSHKADWVEETVAQIALLRLSEPEAGAMWAQGGSEADAADARAEVVRLREKLKQLREDYMNDDLERSEYHELRNGTQERLSAAEERLATMTGTSPVAHLISAPDMEAAWEDMTMEQTRAAIGWVFEEIRLLPRGRGARGSKPEQVVVEFKGAERHLQAV